MEMKVAIAIDSFKGSLSSVEAGTAAAAGIDAFFPILRKIVTLDEALAAPMAAANLTATVEQAFRLLKS